MCASLFKNKSVSEFNKKNKNYKRHLLEINKICVFIGHYTQNVCLFLFVLLLKENYLVKKNEKDFFLG